MDFLKYLRTTGDQTFAMSRKVKGETLQRGIGHFPEVSTASGEAKAIRCSGGGRRREEHSCPFPCYVTIALEDCVAVMNATGSGSLFWTVFLVSLSACKVSLESVFSNYANHLKHLAQMLGY